MWEGADTVGLLSCIIGTVLLFIPLPGLLLLFVCLIGGGGVLAMGIVAVVKDSKIGIGGIIIGGILLFFALFGTSFVGLL